MEPTWKITVEFQKDGKRKILSEIEKIKTETKKSEKVTKMIKTEV